MLNVQSTPPEPEPVESLSVVSSAVTSASIVACEMSPPLDQTYDVSWTPTVCMSLKSTSSNASVPVGTGLVLFCSVDPVTSANSVSEADSGPLVTTTASFAPSIVIVTVCDALEGPSLTA